MMTAESGKWCSRTLEQTEGSTNVEDGRPAPSPPKPPAWLVCRRLFAFAPPSAGALSSVLLLTVLGALVAVALPWPLQFLVDHVFAAQGGPAWGEHALELLGVVTQPQRVIALALLTLALSLAGGLVNVIKTRLEVATGQGSVYELRARLFDHCQRLSLRDHHALALGDRLYRVNTDTYCIDQLLLAGLLPLLGSAITLFAMFGILWRLDPPLAALALAILPLLAACVRYHMGPLERESLRVSERESEVLGLAQSVLSALPIVKAFVREAHETRRFREQGQRALSARLRLTTREAWFAFVAQAVTALGTALVIAVGGLHVVAGKLTVGQLLVVIAYLAAVYEPLHMISYTLGQMQAALAGARRVLEVLETDLEWREEEGPAVHALPAVRGHIRFERVVFGYRPGAPVLRDISFEVPAGTLTAIVGPTGAGKTTLISLLLRFYHPQSGRILVDGVDILQGVAVASVRRQISVVPQEPVLFPVSIAENIRYGRPGATDAEVRQAAIAAHAEEFIRALPRGYDTPVAEGSTSLSGGERQRLALARAFIKAAPILILDEPTSAVDAATETLILDSLARLTVGRSTLVIAHRLSTIRRADQILFLQDGCIVERGTHQELLRQEGAYAQLHRLYVRATGTEVSHA